MSGKGELADTCFITKFTPNFPRASNPPCRERAVASRRASGDAVEIGPADLTELRSRSGTGLLDNASFASWRGSTLGFSATSTMAPHHIRRGKHPHSVQKPDQMLLIATR
jgi:hypothetical protein